MSKIKNDLEKFEFIIEKIEDLESFVIKYDKISLLLEDTMGRDASLMCLLQVGETLNKLHKDYEQLDKEDIKGAYNIRNFIAHDYEGVRLALIENIIRTKIPQLKETIKNIIKQEE